MRYITLSLLAFLSLTSPNILAQVYQSTDEQGHIIFSDHPTADSREITIENPNIGDAVEVPPPAPEPPPEPEPEVKELPASLEGDLVGVKEKKSKKRRWRRAPRGSR